MLGIAEMGRPFILASQSWELALMGRLPKLALASKVWFLLVDVVVDGGGPGAKSEGALVLLFKFLGHCGSTSMVAFFGHGLHC